MLGSVTITRKRSITPRFCYPGIPLGSVMSTVLTTQSVARLKPDPHNRLEIADALLPGLYLVIQPSGKKSWAVRYRHGGQSRKLTLGGYPVFELAAARERAREALQAVAAGRDPATEKQEARRRAKEGRPDHGLVSVQVDRFLERYVRPKLKPRNALNVEQACRKVLAFTAH